MKRQLPKFIWTAAFAAIVFRAELCLLLGLIVLVELATQRLSLLEMLKHALPAGVVCLGEKDFLV